MSNPENHFDNTLWDPVNPEHAIEDPMHGSEAVMSLLDTPPMPLPDGTYHVFGGYYLIGTNTFDASGKPFKKIGVPGSTGFGMLRDVQRMEQWHEIVASGELPEGYPENHTEFFDFTAKPYIIFER